MKKILCLIVLSLFLFAPIAQAEKYINGVDKNRKPYAYVDEKTGKATGFDVDSMSWIAANMGFEIEQRPMDGDGIILELITGEIDMICSAMPITAENQLLINFSEPYWSISKVIIVERMSELTMKDILSSKAKLGIKQGTTAATEMVEYKKNNKYPLVIEYYEDYPIMLKNLMLGNIDAVYMDEFVAKDIVAEGNEFKIAGVHGEIKKFGVAFRKDDRFLGHIINRGYKLLKADPYWKELQVKYLVDK